MASYQKHGFSLSTAQVKKLSKGDKIRIKHESLHGPHPVYLTKTQHARMSKAHAAKKGMDLQMSGAQLRHHLKHGGSIFDTLKDWGKSALGYLAPIGQKIIQDKVLPRLAARAGPLLDQAIDSGLSRLGAGTRRKKQMKVLVSLTIFGVGLRAWQIP